MRFLSELIERPWLRAWKVLFVLSTVYLVGVVGFAIVTLPQIDQDQGHAAGFAAMAIIAMVAVALVAYVLALIGTVLLKREIAKPIVGALLLFGGLFVYLTSGGFVGFLPIVLGGVGVGGLAIYEELS